MDDGARLVTGSDGRPGDSRADRLRLRAAWMYFVEQMTQSDIADVLGVGRVTVVRMLAEARARNEVRIAIEGSLAELVRLERALEQRFNLTQAIVAPLPSADADPTAAISAATGGYLSDAMQSGMAVGVGWGRTLFAALSHLAPKPLAEFKVISLLGGVGAARRFNPAEFAWRFAQSFHGEGYLLPAPAIVDSVATRTALIERCGLSEIFAMADTLDAVLVSVGGAVEAGAQHRSGFFSPGDLKELARRGAVGDLLFHFYDIDGVLVDHPANRLVMSVDVDRLRRAPLRILTSGGPEKIQALLGAMKLVEPTVLITDEASAMRMLEDGR